MHGQIASGVGWMVAFKLVDRGLAVVSTLILARLLVPADFGLVAMAMSVIAILELATSFSFEVALIQRQELDRAHYDTAWSLNALLALACAAATALLAYPTALFYNEPRLNAVMLALAGGWIFSGLENPGLVDFRRRMEFRREFYFLASKRVLSFAITVVLALSLRSYWALVAGSIAGRVLGAALSYAMHGFRPRPCLQAARELFGFSGWMLANNLLSVAQSKVPHFAVGRFLGSQPLGLYTVGAEFAQIPTSDLIAPVNRVLFPGLARLADDLAQFRRTFLDVIAVTTLFAVPAAVGVAAVAQPLVLVLLGPKWLEAVPVIRILALAGAVLAMTSCNGSAYLALGQPRFITLVAGARLVVLVPLAFALTAYFGLVGAAYAELATALAGLLVSLPVVLRRLHIRARDYAAIIWRPALASAVMAYAVLSLLDRMIEASSSLQALPVLAAAVATGVAVHFATIGCLWFAAGRPPGAEQLLVARARGWLKPAAARKA
ncbi:MAG: lipopolysaccharide biosynthesis protein [Burkholderiaceae bacterium]